MFRKVMGDAPLAYAETVGGVRVSEDDGVTVGKNDVRLFVRSPGCEISGLMFLADLVVQGGEGMSRLV